MTEIIQPLVDTENTFMKVKSTVLLLFIHFLELRDELELRRKELLHKSWTERVWFPLQRKVEQHLSSWGPTEAERRRSSFRNYLQQRQAEGFVFLETYDVNEYSPFPLKNDSVNSTRIQEFLQTRTKLNEGSDPGRKTQKEETKAELFHQIYSNFSQSGLT
uniref:Uncharacterized protein n=1 Tax=Acanthochromis polyacanthus TaxID=80966 RepID=A0A3Q1GA12_9TELE